MTNQPDSNDNDHKMEKDADNCDFSNPIITSTNNSSSANNGDVCRDYLRNTCRRGANCKFNHPELNEKKGDIPLLTFCHDFQNRECKRNNCKFVHCSKQDEETYKMTGKLPPTVNYSLNGLNVPNSNNNNQNNNCNTINVNNNGNTNNNNNNKFNNSKKFNNNNNYSQPNNYKDQDAPICKDFVKGDCFRGQRCKFKHVNNDQQERNFNSNNSFDSGPFTGNMQSNNNSSNPSFDNRFNMMQQRYDQLNQLKPNSLSNHPMNRNDNQFQMTMERRNNMRPMYEPDPKRRAFDSGYNTPTTFTFANNNANNQLCVTNTLNHQLHHHSNPVNGTSNSEPTASTNSTTSCSNAAQTAALAAAIAINELNGSNVPTSATSNTITRSMYSNLNDNRFLYEENNSLRRKIDELKQQVVDLMNANEFLLEQNAQLRGSLLPATSVNQNVNQVVSTTLHNQVASALHTSAVVQPKPPTNTVVPASSQPLAHIGATITNPLSNQTAADLLVANHLHRQNQQRAVGVVASATSALSTNPLSAASSISSLTSTSTSTPLVSYPIMSASIPASIHSLGHLTH